MNGFVVDMHLSYVKSFDQNLLDLHIFFKSGHQGHSKTMFCWRFFFKGKNPLFLTAIFALNNWNFFIFFQWKRKYYHSFLRVFEQPKTVFGADFGSTDPLKYMSIANFKCRYFLVNLTPIFEKNELYMLFLNNQR